MPIRESRDPNDKFGVMGYGPQAFIQGETLIPYRVNFENLGSGSQPEPTEPATAPAQRVVITDQLSGDLDWSTLRFTAFGFGDNDLSVPAGRQYHFAVVPMTDEDQTFDVEVELSFDSATGEVRAAFQSINPDTFLPPEGLAGFLPPEDGSGNGQGYISFDIQTKAGLPTGTEIRNVALISFDSQTIIATNQVDPQDPTKGTDPAKEALQTIDADAPTSSIGLLPGTSLSPFMLWWTGEDDPGGSGIAFFEIFVSVDGGHFALFQKTTETSIGFMGEAGRTYAFYSVATDNVGHREAMPTAAQAITYVNIPPTLSLSAAPDPVVVPGVLSLTAEDLIDVDGEVMRVEFYRDTNANGVWDIGDQLLGYTLEGADGDWILSGVSTVGWELGIHTLFARALDNDGAWSEAAVTTVVVDQIATTRIDLTIVHDPSALEGNGMVAALPASADWVHEWQTFWVEIWVSTPDTTSLRVARATVDLAYDSGYLTAQEIVHGPAFTADPTGTIDDAAGLVSGISGRTDLTDVGDDGYVLLARVRFASIADSQVTVDELGRNIGPYDMQMALVGGQTVLMDVGAVEPELGASPGTELWAVVYDIDDNNRIDFGDLSFFAAAFGLTVGSSAEPPYVWWADFDKSGRVDFGDLAFFAPNFGKTRDQVQSGAQTLVFPPNFPDAWRPVPAEPGGEGGAMGGEGEAMGDEAVHLPSSAAVFAQFGIAEAERTPPWLRPRPAATGHESRLINRSPQPEFPATPHSPGNSSVAAPAERAQDWSEDWEPLEDLFSLLADQPSDQLLNPHEAVFAQVGRLGIAFPS